MAPVASLLLLSTSLAAQTPKTNAPVSEARANSAVVVDASRTRPKRPRAPPNLAAFVRHEASVVRIESPGVAPLTGFFVSSRGLILTAAKSLTLEQTVSIELASGDRRQGEVVATSSEGLAAIEVRALKSDGHWASLPLAPKTTPRPRGWLIALGHAPRGHMLPTAGEVANGTAAEWLLDVPATVGAPVLNRSGEVVAVVAKKVSAAQTRALSVATVHRLLSAATAP